MITGRTNVFGIMGDPVEHSLSPPMHNAAFKKLEMDSVYVPFHVKKGEIGAAIQGALAMEIKGLNLTIPHKTSVIEHLDEIDHAAELIGAVNTVKFNNGARGYNTDGMGAVRAIEEVTPVKNKKVVILGAGGAARAVSFQILLEGAGEVVIANRTVGKAKNLRNDLVSNLDASVKSSDLDLEVIGEIQDADILINTTPIGMYPNIDEEPLINADVMHEGLVVNDIVYNPFETGLLKEAKKAGAKVVPGTKMLIYQGVEAFKIWTGVEAPVDVFEKALMKELGLGEEL